MGDRSVREGGGTLEVQRPDGSNNLPPSVAELLSKLDGLRQQVADAIIRNKTGSGRAPQGLRHGVRKIKEELGRRGVDWKNESSESPQVGERRSQAETEVVGLASSVPIAAIQSRKEPTEENGGWIVLQAGATHEACDAFFAGVRGGDVLECRGSTGEYLAISFRRYTPAPPSYGSPVVYDTNEIRYFPGLDKFRRRKADSTSPQPRSTMSGERRVQPPSAEAPQEVPRTLDHETHLGRISAFLRYIKVREITTVYVDGKPLKVCRVSLGNHALSCEGTDGSLFNLLNNPSGEFWDEHTVSLDKPSDSAVPGQRSHLLRGASEDECEEFFGQLEGGDGGSVESRPQPAKGVPESPTTLRMDATSEERRAFFAGIHEGDVIQVWNNQSGKGWEDVTFVALNDYGTYWTVITSDGDRRYYVDTCLFRTKQ